MRSFGRLAVAVALVAALLPAAPRAQSRQAADLYQQARTREAALRKELGSSSAATSTDLITRMRTLARTYEDLWRLFPTSPYSDDALWYGAMLSGDVFWQSGDAADRTRALKMLQALTANFPTSSLLKHVPPQVAKLEAAQPARPAETAARAVASPPAPSPAPAQTPAPVTPTSVPGSIKTATTATYATLTGIRRDVLADVVRVTLELEREPVFTSERIDGPPRVFIDMQNTRVSEPLRDATLPFADDVVRQIRVGRQLNGRIRVVMDLATTGKYSVYALYNPFRIVIDFDRKQPGTQPAVQQASGAVGRTLAGPPAEPNKARPTATSPTAGTATAAASTDPVGRTLSGPSAEPIKARPTIPAGKGPEPGDSFSAAAAVPAASGAATSPPAKAAATAPPSAPAANSSGSFSLSRQLGLGIARIVIDPGHGGHDPGAQVKGLSEAEVTLDIALRLEKLFTKESGVQVVLTRRNDTFVSLQERTAIANRDGADLFLSIHANANDDASLRGVETYFLNLSPNPEAGRIAARENAASSQTMHEVADIVKAIALNDKIDESRDFATIVQAALYEKLRTSNRALRNLGVKQAPFVVLIGATMPSVLAEISFLTNRQDAALLKTEKYRQQIAEALYQGVMRYQQALKKVPAVAAR
jgi:N-acetylmuramoyl-L-alanine amidase